MASRILSQAVKFVVLLWKYAEPRNLGFSAEIVPLL